MYVFLCKHKWLNGYNACVFCACTSCAYMCVYLYTYFRQHLHHHPHPPLHPTLIKPNTNHPILFDTRPSIMKTSLPPSRCLSASGPPCAQVRRPGHGLLNAKATIKIRRKRVKKVYVLRRIEGRKICGEVMLGSGFLRWESSGTIWDVVDSINFGMLLIVKKIVMLLIVLA